MHWPSSSIGHRLVAGAIVLLPFAASPSAADRLVGLKDAAGEAGWGLSGHFWDDLKKAIDRIPEKGEFETTLEYQERRSAAKARVFGEDILLARFPGNLSYDADAQSWNIDLEARYEKAFKPWCYPVRFSGGSTVAMYDVSDTDQSRPSLLRCTTQSLERLNNFDIALSREEASFRGRSTGRHFRITFSFTMPRDQARQVGALDPTIVLWFRLRDVGEERETPVLGKRRDVDFGAKWFEIQPIALFLESNDGEKLSAFVARGMKLTDGWRQARGRTRP